MVDHTSSPTSGPQWMRWVERKLRAAEANTSVVPPIGSMVLLAGAQPPPVSWLECDGRGFSAVEYPALVHRLGATNTPAMPGYAGQRWIIRAR